MWQILYMSQFCKISARYSLVPGLPNAGESQAVVNLRAVSFGKYPNWVALEGLAKFAIINMAVYFRELD
jgi:hypothetical protein